MAHEDRPDPTIPGPVPLPLAARVRLFWDDNKTRSYVCFVARHSEDGRYSTTILGMLPLLRDAFFVSMAVTTMFGLGFATVLTLIVVRVLYAIFFRVPSSPGGSRRA